MLERLKPKFWDHKKIDGSPYKHLFNFRLMWAVAVAFTSIVTLAPLISITLIDYGVTQNSIMSENLLRTSRLVSNTRRAVSFFLTERKSALDFVVRDNTYVDLNDPKLLGGLLTNLKDGFGGFVDLGVIGPTGIQTNYVGPYELEGIDYSAQEWYKEVLDRGVYISDVFLGFRHVPHLVIAIKHAMPSGAVYVLRATLDTEWFNDLLSKLELSGQGDAFIINRDGVLQTPSRNHGKVLERAKLTVPEHSQVTKVYEEKEPNGEPLIIGYAYIADTPFILMIVKSKRELMKPWYMTRLQLIGFLVGSITIILFVIVALFTFLVNRVYVADQRRVMTLHEMEYANKMASLGRLAAGVAHEINNPLAVINEKAGLVKDLFTFNVGYTRDERLIGLVDSLISSVERCGRITKRLLNFARHIDVSIQPIDLEEVIHDVLGFLGKEAEYRSIGITVSVEKDLPKFESDRGKLQQIFLNIINNAFAALRDGGRLEIMAVREGRDSISIRFKDNGVGIPEEHLQRIFEPFFSTKTREGGTGLGLSITYGLVQELGGHIDVESEVDKGTTFIITLPLTIAKKEKKTHEGLVG